MTAYRKPEALLDELGISEPREIDVEAIAQYCGATVLYGPLYGCEARLVGFGDRAFITARTDRPRGRQRFSAAHELGHWMRDRNRVAYVCEEAIFKLAWSVDNPERRANRYAAGLLLPEGMFKPRAREQPIIFETVRELAKVFETSLTATAIRLVEIGPSPAMLVCSSKDHRKWFTKGDDVKALWPRDRIGTATAAADLLRDSNAPAAGPTEVSADEWIDHPDASRYSLIEDSRRIGDELVLSLLWWKDERQLLDLESND